VPPKLFAQQSEIDCNRIGVAGEQRELHTKAGDGWAGTRGNEAENAWLPWLVRAIGEVLDFLFRRRSH
jgi:hypothetical protein